MSKLRDEIEAKMLGDLTPQQAIIALDAIAEGLDRKIREYYLEFGSEVDQSFAKGLMESYALIMNVNSDIKSKEGIF